VEKRDSWRGASIKVIGVGGAGGNAVDRMIQVGIRAVDFIVANTDAQALARSEASCRIQLGERLTRGLGAGGDPAVGAEAAEQSRETLEAAMQGADMVFIAAGMGGGTGSGAAPVVAQIAREKGALIIAVVTMPFIFEGSRRQAIAEAGIRRLEAEVDTAVLVPNDRLLHLVNERVSLDIAFRIADEVLRQGIQGISELVTQPGLINLDFADVRSIMDRAGGALVSMGYGEGKEKAVEAARIALGSPLLDIESVNGTDGLLVNVTGGEDLTLAEINKAMEIISRAAMPHAQILFGAVIDPRMKGRVQITLIATGLSIGKVTTVPGKAEGVSLPFNPTDLFGDDLTVPAFMRSSAQAQPVWRA
jgi:cell division protein FtsZ